MKLALYRSKIAILLMGTIWLGFLPRYAISQDNTAIKSGYIASKESVQGVFNALSSAIKKPIVLSKLVVRKQISGTFDLKDPQTVMENISHQLGLIWYQDGKTIYVYEASETRSQVVTLQNTSLNVLNNFLRKAGLLDDRYPLKGDDASGTFYISGPPIYVELITSAAQLLDGRSDGYDGREKVTAIPLYNTFVEDRAYKYRDERIVIPGIANVVRELLGNSTSTGGVASGSNPRVDADNKQPSTSTMPALLPPAPNLAWPKREQSSTMTITSNANTNSLLVRGSAEQINYARNLIAELDMPKRHVELSVWIVDVQKDMVDQLGVKWSGGVDIGSSLGISLNGGASTLDGGRFLASVLALSQRGQANIVSRPMVLTQENIPALFDNNKTYYTKLIGERSVELQHVTYGTLVSVLPRFTENNEIEMMLNIEDGNQLPSNTDVGGLPEVGRTSISTIARVPKGKSLLIGGYTRDESSEQEGKIPLLADIPFIGQLFRYRQNRSANMVRIFLIQPREITEPLVPDANQFIAEKIQSAKAGEPLNDWVRNYMSSQK